jgi:hypothetical protein
MTATHFIIGTICIGIANTCIEWFFIGFLFHRFQALTPNTWKPESSKSYMYSTFLSFLFGALFMLFYWKIASNYVMYRDMWSHIKLGLICFACFSFVQGINGAIYVNYDKKFVAGTLISSCISIVAAAVIAGFFYMK